MTRTLSLSSLCVALLVVVAACERDRGDQGTNPSSTEGPTKQTKREVRPPLSETNARAALMDPSMANETAPDEYTVRLETSQGEILIDVHRDWAPNGADRFYNLVRIGFFENIAVFRVLDGFMAQTGLNGDPQVNAAWRRARIPDDQRTESNSRGMVTFATSGPNSRTTQFFINFGNNARLDSMGFTPIGRVRDMATADRFYSAYGEGAPQGRGPAQGRIQREGNAYLEAEFPELDYIRNARIVE